MRDRRNHKRFEIPHSLSELRILEDVVLESMQGNVVSVIARTPSAAGEERTLHISGRSGCAETVTVRTSGSTPVVIDDGIRHRLRLDTVRSFTQPGPSAAARQTWTEDEAIACALVRRIAARLVDVSARGCLVETAAQVTVGTAALLDILVNDVQYIEMIRISRVTAMTGSPMRFRAGAEFMPTFEATSRSIRQVAAHLEIRHSGLAAVWQDYDLLGQR